MEYNPNNNTLIVRGKLMTWYENNMYFAAEYFESLDEFNFKVLVKQIKIDLSNNDYILQTPIDLSELKTPSSIDLQAMLMQVSGGGVNLFVGKIPPRIDHISVAAAESNITLHAAMHDSINLITASLGDTKYTTTLPSICVRHNRIQISVKSCLVIITLHDTITDAARTLQKPVIAPLVRLIYNNFGAIARYHFKLNYSLMMVTQVDGVLHKYSSFTRFFSDNKNMFLSPNLFEVNNNALRLESFFQIEIPPREVQKGLSKRFEEGNNES